MVIECRIGDAVCSNGSKIIIHVSLTTNAETIANMIERERTDCS